MGKLTFLSLVFMVAVPTIGLFTSTNLSGKVSYSYRELLDLLLVASVLSGLIGGGLVLSLPLLGKLGGSNRGLLLAIFKPALKITQLSTALLLLVHAFILTTSIYYLEVFYIKRVHMFLILGVGLVSGVAALKILWLTIIGFKDAEMNVIGKSFTKNQQPKLWEFVESVCNTCGVSIPQNIVIGIDPNFYVTEAKVNASGTNLKGRTLYMSLPFLRVMTVDEVKGVIGHELGHFSGQDTAFSKKFYPIYRGAQENLTVLQSDGNNDEGSSSSLALIPSLYMNALFLESFSHAENKISRERELKADDFSAKHFGKESLAKALIKVHAFSGSWSFIEEEMLEVLASGKQLRNTSHYFSEVLKRINKEKLISGLMEHHIVHPTDSHPSLNLRMENLLTKFSNEEIVKILNVEDEGEIDFIDNLEEIEQELTDQENQKLLNIAHYFATVKNHAKNSTEKTDKEKSQDVYNTILRKSLVYAMAADGDVDDSEREMLIVIYEKVTGEKLEKLEVISYVNSIGEWSKDFFENITKISDALNPEGKELILKAVLYVIAADGKVDEGEKDYLATLSASLGYPSEKLADLVNEVFGDREESA